MPAAGHGKGRQYRSPAFLVEGIAAEVNRRLLPIGRAGGRRLKAIAAGRTGLEVLLDPRLLFDGESAVEQFLDLLPIAA